MAAKIKVLVVVTNTSDLGTTGIKTGWYLPEVAHPWKVFKNADFDITYVSPNGGAAPMDPGSKEAFKDDKICQEFLTSGEVTKLENTETPSKIDISQYKVIFYAGGHGPMYDLPKSKEIAKLCTRAYESGAVVAAVCHGVVGLEPVKLSDGTSIVKDQTVTCFTNSEEDAVKLSGAMPFLLETKLRELGAKFVCADNFQPKVQTSGRIVTGQKPASATPLAEQVVALVKP